VVNYLKVRTRHAHMVQGRKLSNQTPFLTNNQEGQTGT